MFSALCVQKQTGPTGKSSKTSAGAAADAGRAKKGFIN